MKPVKTATFTPKKILYVLFLILLGNSALEQVFVSKDTLHRKKEPIFYASFNGGICLPIASYGSTTPVYVGGGYQNSTYSFANTGITFSLAASLNIWRGWELTCLGAYIHQSFNASKYLDENQVSDVGGRGNSTDTVSYYPFAVNLNGDNIVVGKYYYEQYFILLGFGKMYYLKHFSYGFHFLLGPNFLYVPSIHGINTADTVGRAFQRGTITYNWNVNGKLYNGAALDIGGKVSFILNAHLSCTLDEDFLLSGENDLTVGVATDFSGNFLYSSTHRTATFQMFNTTIGIEYRF